MSFYITWNFQKIAHHMGVSHEMAYHVEFPHEIAHDDITYSGNVTFNLTRRHRQGHHRQGHRHHRHFQSVNKTQFLF